MLKLLATLLIVAGPACASAPVAEMVPPKPPRAPVVMVPPPAEAPMIHFFDAPSPDPAVEGYADSYVLVEGLEGRLVVLPSIMEEFKLRLGQRIPVELMYKLLERNQKLY